MSKRINAIRGMNDILPANTAIWQHFEHTVSDVLKRYGYGEIRMPIVESTDLFKRSIGEVTDIVEKEMYTFTDRNGDSLTLRPEGTASCVRAGEEHGLLYNQVQRFWYAGPMFRHEKPQKGRYRQFHQVGVEAFGIASADIDAELIMMTARLWKALGVEQAVTLELNTLGSNEDRQAYRQALVTYLKQHESQLDEDSLRRLDSNPLRILDSKNPDMQSVLEGAPALMDYLGEAAVQHFNQLKALLDAAGINYVINPRLVRGLDYYNFTVFEWVTSQLGAQGTVCAGGRYDGLVQQLGGKATPAVGMAMGVERLILLLAACEQTGHIQAAPDVYVLGDDPAALLGLAESLRDQAPSLRIQTHCGGGKLRKQMKKADDSGAAVALILGAEELQAGTAAVKWLRSGAEQQVVARDTVAAVVLEQLEQQE